MYYEKETILDLGLINQHTSNQSHFRRWIEWNIIITIGMMNLSFMENSSGTILPRQTSLRHFYSIQGISTLLSFLISFILLFGFGINFSYYRGTYRNNLFATESMIIIVCFSSAIQDLVILLTLERLQLLIHGHNAVSWSLSSVLHLIAGLSLVIQLSQTCYFTSFCTMKIIGGIFEVLLGGIYVMKTYLILRKDDSFD
ncbi:unnamed protein product [Lepeophtheirus salmonis]|uniref:(salmon louse) hypothetical protein n=1 Tax=Lepeophtheirus salmonis TaxID=72036 RepID=A0A7R8CDI0_LEPSM|nr:unnamed protein product [Lepeophtheirus salmonis]CAF2777102.1 unnamed protein product [Lepeophtheirus salmonis]